VHPNRSRRCDAHNQHVEDRSSVADLAGVTASRSSIARSKIVRERLIFTWQEIDDVFGAAIKLGVAFCRRSLHFRDTRTPMATRFADRRA
jgi:hypothetical protein